MNNEGTYERELTAAELFERRKLRDELDDARDDVLSEIAEKKREIKEAQVEESRLDARIRQLRWEIKTGKVTVPRQAALPLDRVTFGDSNGHPVSDPRDIFTPRDRVADGPGVPFPESTTFETADTLLQRPNRWGEGDRLDVVDLRWLITLSRQGEVWPTEAQVGSWHQDARDDVQRWCRIEHAHRNPIAGLPLPPREQMPDVLANLEHRAKPAKKRAAKKRAAKAE